MLPWRLLRRMAWDVLLGRGDSWAPWVALKRRAGWGIG